MVVLKKISHRRLGAAPPSRACRSPRSAKPRNDSRSPLRRICHHADAQRGRGTGDSPAGAAEYRWTSPDGSCLGSPQHLARAAVIRGDLSVRSDDERVPVTPGSKRVVLGAKGLPLCGLRRCAGTDPSCPGRALPAAAGTTERECRDDDQDDGSGHDRDQGPAQAPTARGLRSQILLASRWAECVGCGWCCGFQVIVGPSSDVGAVCGHRRIVVADAARTHSPAVRSSRCSGPQLGADCGEYGRGRHDLVMDRSGGYWPSFGAMGS